MKKNWILVLIFTLLFSTSVFAQQEVTKVGVIDTSRVYQSQVLETTKQNEPSFKLKLMQELQN